MAAADPVLNPAGLAEVGLGGTPESLGGKVEPDDDWLIDLTGRGWLERKQTGGRARYWYQRWRETSGGKVVKRSMYLAPLLGNEGAREHGTIKRRSR